MMFISAQLAAQPGPAGGDERDHPPVSIVAVGDTTGFRILPESPAHTDPLAGVNGLLEQADLFIFNHEGALFDPDDAADACRAFGTQSVFHSPPEFADYLALAAGADIVIGHGSHVPQGLLTSDVGIAMLSLGNFMFNPSYEFRDVARLGTMVWAGPQGATIRLLRQPARAGTEGQDS